MRSAFIIAFVFLQIQVLGQNKFQVLIRDAKSGEPLHGANVTIKDISIGTSADESGIAQLENIPNGTHVLLFSFVGYRTQTKQLRFPSDVVQPFDIRLERDEEELEEIVISSTRSSRTIADIPTRVEFIAGEELDEKGNMKPGDIRMLLNESTGIQTQQTSATSANASIRIQGLDGRYTQILKDGFPLYAGFSGGLGLLQTPPLDLKQVEVIKGSTSTLYGGGAIAGLVNLISQTPQDNRDLKFFINGTSAKGLDLSGYYGQRFGKLGLTVFGSRNSNEAYDPADIDLTAIPKFERYTINPKFVVDFTEKTNLNVGLNFTTENRVGGDIKYIEGNGDATHSYYEKNDSKRYSTQLSFMHKFGGGKSINFKNSVSHFDRAITTPGYRFNGVQNSTFTEFNFISSQETTEWIAGVNLWTDGLSEEQFSNTFLRDYDQTTFGVFVQNNFSFSDEVSLEPAYAEIM